MADSSKSEKTPSNVGIREQALPAVQSNAQIAAAQRGARDLQAKTNKLRDPAERQRMLQEAYDREIALHGDTKLARRLQSGAWQGAAGGVGIGGGIAMGLGATVGTLVGGVVAVPTTALGGIIGTGVGAIHGPWFTLKKGGNKDSTGNLTPEQVRAAQEAADQSEWESKEARLQVQKEVQMRNLPEGFERKRPRKLECRNALNAVNGSVAQPANRDDDVHNMSRRKPRKLELRSGMVKGDK
ncbi:Hypothetical protein R9X50_00789700 [Acrodontium crateriforme]|uniref:Uncharacterized protein n=1 Tax=Acrodontium crateriforme TaxID=150365 RepID=A0AAQ3MAY0_9PEZI|nr:Hypothetical protein R9X50_00789700 [Acrodontium crateriforme]